VDELGPTDAVGHSRVGAAGRVTGSERARRGGQLRPVRYDAADPKPRAAARRAPNL